MALAMAMAVTGALAQTVTFPATVTFQIATNSTETGSTFSKDKTITTHITEEYRVTFTNGTQVITLGTNFLDRTETRRFVLTDKGWVKAPMLAPSGQPPPLPQHPNPHRIEIP